MKIVSVVAWAFPATFLAATLALAMLGMGTRAVGASMVYVSPAGQDEATHGSAVGTPYRTIGYALSRARPGMTIVVLPGTYAEHLKTRVHGTAKRPITLKASGTVVLRGDDRHGRILELLHNHYVIDGFEFTGRDVLLWLQGASHNTITRNVFRNADSECVRMKYHSRLNLFSRNRVTDCGREDFARGGKGKNGEGIYLGTAPEQLQRNPTHETDHTNQNTIRNNTFVTNGNECVDIKEGSERNIVEFNDCTEQRDSHSGGFDARGNENTFRYNRSHGNAGAGIRFGGDTAADGVNNEAYGNVLTDNRGVALKVLRFPQGRICGNTHSGNLRGLSNTSKIGNPACGFPLPSPGVQ